MPQFGTGDLTGLAATALALIGERPWRSAEGLLTRALLPPAVADADRARLPVVAVGDQVIADLEKDWL
jgi:hypothetical protein